MERSDEQWKFDGFASPNFTTVPDEFFDVLASRLNGAEVKALLYIIRRTFGFKKERDSISISQMLNGIVRKTGERLDLGVGLSKPSLCRALNTLADKNIILTTRQYDYKGGNMATSYQLNMRGHGATAGEGGAPETPLGKKMRQGGVVSKVDQGLVSDFDQPLVKKRDIQYTVDNKQSNKNVNVAKKEKGETNYLRLIPDAQSEQAHIDLIATDILECLGDRQSESFYRLVARKVPESTIRRLLSELKEGRVRSKPRVFTHEVMRFAETCVNEELDEQTKMLKESRSNLLARLRHE
jgi:DNA-binding transcriptional ArsR family regulator